MGIASETGLAVIIFLYLPVGATYINSSDRGKRQYRRISSSELGRGRGDAANRMRIYIARTLRSFQEFPILRAIFNWPRRAFRNNLRRRCVIYCTNACLNVYTCVCACTLICGRAQSLSWRAKFLAKSQSVARDFARFTTCPVATLTSLKLFSIADYGKITKWSATIYYEEGERRLLFREVGNSHTWLNRYYWIL